MKTAIHRSGEVLKWFDRGGVEKRAGRVGFSVLWGR